MNVLENKIKNISVRGKLMLMIGIMVVSLIILGIMAGSALTVINQNTTDLGDGWLPSLNLAHQGNTLTSDFRIAQYAHLTAEDEETMKSYEEEMDSIEKEMNEKLAEYDAIIVAEDDRKIFNEARELWNTFLSGNDTFLELSKARNMEEGGAYMLGEGKTAYRNFVAKYEELVEYNIQGSRDSKASAAAT